MTTCSCLLNSNYPCSEKSCPNDIPDPDRDTDIEYPAVNFPSTLPGFTSDLECFEKIFPSLLRGIGCAEPDTFEMGWLAGCVHDVILCLTLHLTDNHSEFPKDQSHLLEEALGARYYRPIEEGEKPAPEGFVECVKPKQLLNFYNLIHEAVEVEHLSRPAIPLTDEQVEVKIREKEAMFSTMLDNAIKEMWEMDEDNEEESHEDLYGVRWGWLSAREGKWTYPSWVYGPADVHDEHVQLEPDNTPTEYQTTGDRVPADAFSIPYAGPRPAEGACIVCMEELASNPHGLVVARCTTGHLFHGACLDYWVNDSAMGNANMCPHDRERLCDPRPRVHPGKVSDELDAEEFNIHEEDQEDSDVDAEGSDDEEFDMDADEEDQEGTDKEQFEMDMDIDDEGDEDGLHCADELEEAAFFQFQQTGQDFMYGF